MATQHIRLVLALAIAIAIAPAALSQVLYEEFDSGLDGWQSYGNGIWDASGGLAVQTFGPRDDNCSVLKYADGDWDDFELTVRCRQTGGPTVSSAMQLFFRMGDDPGEGANVPGIGPGYMLGWAPTPTGYGHPDISLSTIEGFYEFSPGYYWFASGATLWSGRMEPDGQVFTINNWIRVRVRAIGDVITIMVDPDSNDPATDAESDFVLVGEVTDSSFSSGRIALNDHYANSEWDYVYVEPMCDLCSANGCDYTCLNWDGVTVTPEVAYTGEGATVSLDYEISGTPGHTIYVGLVVDGECIPFYSGTPGAGGAAGNVDVDIVAPDTLGAYDVQIAVAHVYNAAEFCNAVAQGEADMATIGELHVTRTEDLNKDGCVNLADLQALLAAYGWCAE